MATYIARFIVTAGPYGGVIYSGIADVTDPNGLDLATVAGAIHAYRSTGETISALPQVPDGIVTVTSLTEIV